MLKNKIFILITLLSFSSYAQEKPDYERVYAGNCVQQDGFFFNENGMIKLVVNTEEKLKLISVNKQKDIDLLKIDLQKCSELAASQIKIQKEVYEKQLEIKQKTIDSYASQNYFNGIKLAGAAVIGIATGALIIGILNINK